MPQGQPTDIVSLWDTDIVALAMALAMRKPIPRNRWEPMMIAKLRAIMMKANKRSQIMKAKRRWRSQMMKSKGKAQMKTTS